MVDTVTTEGANTEKSVTLRPFLTRFYVLYLVVFQVWLLVFDFAAVGGLGKGGFWTVTGLVLTLVASLLLWFGIWVRLRPTGLVVRNGFSRRTIGWDEIDSVRLDPSRGRAVGMLTSYLPVLELRDGSELRLRELTSPSTQRRVPRSSPARQVDLIAAYLDRYRAPEGSPGNASQHGQD